MINFLFIYQKHFRLTNYQRSILDFGDIDLNFLVVIILYIKNPDRDIITMTSLKPKSPSTREPQVLTTSTGAPVDDNQNSVTAGEYGPIVLNDFHLIDKLAHFDRERIPERVVHAKGAGAHGFFRVTHDVTKYTKAKVFESIGK